ncbi:sodium-dependent transporter [Dasania sp. GY-MA-18]|uniref:Sodium-dependent transporter n=1 Tax=Dasania phycosphaerae TaxID=2950436 RepID=A0A9J6RID4_9GAMM|nr:MULTISPECIES: sodium-dependent transporter [Dasania]MCR8921321.1 sodium-dependent transporter [Dasania sp. GY-MA-18]MCZ0863749.1 sodium-dependent transporter [Dasania phycosphaerae]MCZ0867477.1 sodium-dependent transporter [Dasania phycosphaerae]
MTSSREQFGSRLGFILAAAGSAVGIGNLVGFPVAATKNGGGAFLLIYALFVAFICLPVMVAELSLGRNTQKDPIGAYRKQAGNRSLWQIAGLLSFFTPFMIAVFYMVITVWIFGYFVEIISGNLDALAQANTFGQFINHKKIFIYLLVVAGLLNVILLSGVKNGIERAAKIMMPALFIMLIGLVAFVLTLDNAWAGVSYYLIPDFSKINAQVINGALSQAFFSLSLGMGILITYGSYVNQKESITSSAKLIALTDTAVAFCAGLLVLPAIFALHPNTDTSQLSNSSVAMIFSFLPQIFLELQTLIGYTGASAVAAIFFLLVFFAAITSMVSITEVPNSSLIDSLHLPRKKALIRLNSAMALFTIACAVSFGMVGWLTDFVSYAGASKSFFDVVVDVFYDTILPLNGLLVCLFVRYRWKRGFNAEVEKGDNNFKGSLTERYINFSLATFIPLILLIIFANTVAQKFFGAALLG